LAGKTSQKEKHRKMLTEVFCMGKAREFNFSFFKHFAFPRVF
jgi:hypothetical protein